MGMRHSADSKEPGGLASPAADVAADSDSQIHVSLGDFLKLLNELGLPLGRLDRTVHVAVQAWGSPEPELFLVCPCKPMDPRNSAMEDKLDRAGYLEFRFRLPQDFPGHVPELLIVLKALLRDQSLLGIKAAHIGRRAVEKHVVSRKKAKKRRPTWSEPVIVVAGCKAAWMKRGPNSSNVEVKFQFDDDTSPVVMIIDEKDSLLMKRTGADPVKLLRLLGPPVRIWLRIRAYQQKEAASAALPAQQSLQKSPEASNSPPAAAEKESKWTWLLSKIVPFWTGSSSANSSSVAETAAPEVTEQPVNPQPLRNDSRLADSHGGTVCSKHSHSHNDHHHQTCTACAVPAHTLTDVIKDRHLSADSKHSSGKKHLSTPTLKPTAKTTSENPSSATQSATLARSATPAPLERHSVEDLPPPTSPSVFFTPLGSRSPGPSPTATASRTPERAGTESPSPEMLALKLKKLRRTESSPQFKTLTEAALGITRDYADDDALDSDDDDGDEDCEHDDVDIGDISHMPTSSMQPESLLKANVEPASAQTCRVLSNFKTATAPSVDNTMRHSARGHYPSAQNKHETASDVDETSSEASSIVLSSSSSSNNSKHLQCGKDAVVAEDAKQPAQRNNEGLPSQTGTAPRHVVCSIRSAKNAPSANNSRASLSSGAASSSSAGGSGQKSGKAAPPQQTGPPLDKKQRRQLRKKHRKQRKKEASHTRQIQAPLNKVMSGTEYAALKKLQDSNEKKAEMSPTQNESLKLEAKGEHEAVHDTPSSSVQTDSSASRPTTVKNGLRPVISLQSAQAARTTKDETQAAPPTTADPEADGATQYRTGKKKKKKNKSTDVATTKAAGSSHDDSLSDQAKETSSSSMADSGPTDGVKNAKFSLARRIETQFQTATDEQEEADDNEDQATDKRETATDSAKSNTIQTSSRENPSPIKEEARQQLASTGAKDDDAVDTDETALATVSMDKGKLRMAFVEDFDAITEHISNANDTLEASADYDPIESDRKLAEALQREEYESYSDLSGIEQTKLAAAFPHVDSPLNSCPRTIVSISESLALTEKAQKTEKKPGDAKTGFASHSGSSGNPNQEAQTDSHGHPTRLVVEDVAAQGSSSSSHAANVAEGSDSSSRGHTPSNASTGLGHGGDCAATVTPTSTVSVQSTTSRKTSKTLVLPKVTHAHPPGPNRPQQQSKSLGPSPLGAQSKANNADVYWSGGEDEGENEKEKEKGDDEGDENEEDDEFDEKENNRDPTRQVGHGPLFPPNTIWNRASPRANLPKFHARRQPALGHPSISGRYERKKYCTRPWIKPEKGWWWNLDSEGFRCSIADCQAQCNLWDGISTICPRCGPYSYVRYCSTAHLLRDIKSHWPTCGSRPFRNLCKDSTIPPDVRDGPPALPTRTRWENVERHRQSVYFNAKRNEGDYFIFADLPIYINAGLPQDISEIRATGELFYVVKFDNLETKDRFRRLLAVCLFAGVEQIALVDYLYRMLRDRIRAVGHWNKDLDSCLRYQIGIEMQVQIFDIICRDLHACPDEWDDSNGRQCWDTHCILERPNINPAFYGPKIRQRMEWFESHHWLLRAVRHTHPRVKKVPDRVRGQGFPQVHEKERRLFWRGVGWDGIDTGEMEIEGVNCGNWKVNTMPRLLEVKWDQ